MKINYKRVILVGFAFFLISSFWIAYDAIVPLILTRKYGLNNAERGFIMALDNILSLFMLPLFGSILIRQILSLVEESLIFSLVRFLQLFLLLHRHS